MVSEKKVYNLTSTPLFTIQSIPDVDFKTTLEDHCDLKTTACLAVDVQLKSSFD